jgi:hypothetical protein
LDDYVPPMPKKMNWLNLTAIGYNESYQVDKWATGTKDIDNCFQQTII